MNHEELIKKISDGKLDEIEKEEIKNNPALIQTCINIIRNGGNVDSELFEIPEIALVGVECSCIDLSKAIDILYPERKEELLNSIIINMNNNQEHKLELFKNISEIKPELVNDLIHVLTPEELLMYISDNSYSDEAIELVNNVFENSNINYVTIPNSFDINVIKYEDTKYLYKVLLKSCNEEQLSDFYFNSIEDEEIIDIYLKRHIELNKPFKTQLSKKTDYYNELLNDPTNPLQLNIDLYHKNFISIDDNNKNVFINYIKNIDKLPNNEAAILVDLCITIRNKASLEILNCALNNEKIDIEWFYQRLNIILNKSSNEINKEKEGFYGLVEEFLKKQTAVPLEISKHFGEDIIRKNSLENATEEDFMNSDKYKTKDRKVLELLYQEVSKRLDNNEKVDFEILLNIYNNSISIDNNYFNNPNLILNLDNIRNIFFNISKIDNPILFKALATHLLNNLNKISPSLFKMKPFMDYYKSVNDDSLTPLFAQILINVKQTDFDARMTLKDMITLIKVRKDNELLKNSIKEQLDSKYNLPICLTELYGEEYVREHSLNEDNLKNLEFFSNGKKLQSNNISSLKLLYEKIIERLNNKEKVDVNYLIDLINHGINVDYNCFENEKTIYHMYLDMKYFVEENINNKELIEKFGNGIVKSDYVDGDFAGLAYLSPILKEKIIESILNDKLKIISLKDYCFEPGIIDALIKKGYTKNLITYLIHNDRTLSCVNEEAMETLKEGIYSTYNIEKDAFSKMINTFGNEIILMLENEKLFYVLKQSPENIDRFLELVKDRPLNRSMLEAINDSLRQNIFAKENQDVLTIFPTIMGLIQNGISDDDKNIYITKLVTNIPADFDLNNSLIKYYNSLNISNEQKQKLISSIDQRLLGLFDKNKKLFFSELFDLIRTNQNTYSVYLHIFTTQYIIEKRNRYSAHNDIFKDTNVKYTYDQKKVDDFLFNYLLKNDIYRLRAILNASNIEFLVLKYLYNPDDIVIDDEKALAELKKNINNLRRRFYENIVKYRKSDYLPYEYKILEHTDEFEKQVKKIPILNDNRDSLTEIFGKINFENLFDNVISDSKKYDELLSVVNKYKLLNWGNLFDKSISRLAIGTDEGVLTFINNFSKVYENEVRLENKRIENNVEEMKNKKVSEEEIEKYLEKEKKSLSFNAFKILKYCSIYSGYANCYKVILGVEDFEHVKANKDPNAASYGTTEDRLEKCTRLQIETIQNNEITIPSFISDFKVSNNNKLRAIVGNRAAPFNLTHGERTGACMRAYGYADNNKNYNQSMFEMMNTDSHCFHITFMDPDTNEYVSRVSGFRNGNTVFLNQLRHSVSDKYSDEDVIDACKKMAEKLIKISKNSEMPIDNVVASKSEALKNNKTQHLSECDIGKDVFSGYRDVNQDAVVLATIGENGKAVDVKLNKNQPIYECVRMPVVEYGGEIDNNKHINIQRIKVLKSCVENKNDKDYFKNADIDLLELEREYIHVILGQDFVVTIDKDYEIRYDLIKGDKRAEIEFNDALKKMESLKQELTTRIGGRVNA